MLLSCNTTSMTAMTNDDHLSQTQQDGDMALHLAAQDGHEAAVSVLLDNGADVNTRNYDGNTALNLAALKGHAAALSVLLDNGVDVNTRDVNRYTALQRVLRRYPEEERSDSINGVIELLRNAGAR